MRAVFFFLVLAAPALAEGWKPLTGAGITAALSGQALEYADGTTQNFFADGRTLYRAGAGESWGKWWVADDLYCSTWPPSQTPACFVVKTEADAIRFIGSDGSETLGHTVDP